MPKNKGNKKGKQSTSAKLSIFSQININLKSSLSIKGSPKSITRM